MQRTTIDVQGMHCASCVAKVERALGDVPGVTRASVNLLGKRADVWHADALDEPATGIGIDGRQLHAEQIGGLMSAQEFVLAVVGLAGRGTAGFDWIIGFGHGHRILEINKGNVD